MAELKTVAVALSGGVDSAIAALLVKNKGFNVIGTFIRCFHKSDKRFSSVDDDAKNAKWICNKLEIPFREVDLTEVFNERFGSVYATITHPNFTKGCVPHITMTFNHEIVFKSFYDYCLSQLKVDAIATGHYVKSSFGPFLEFRNVDEKGRLFRGVDKDCDQSYEVCMLAAFREKLQNIMFPVGEFTKSKVREIARENGFERILEQTDTDHRICTLRHDVFNLCFIEEFENMTSGKVVNLDNGEEIGTHKGARLYKVGQRYNDEFYVAQVDGIQNIIFVTSNQNHCKMYCHSVQVSCLYSECEDDPMERFHNNKSLHVSFQYGHNEPLMDGFLFFYEGLCERHDDDIYCILISKNKPIPRVNRDDYIALYEKEECWGALIVYHLPELHNLKKYCDYD